MLLSAIDSTKYQQYQVASTHYQQYRVKPEPIEPSTKNQVPTVRISASNLLKVSMKVSKEIIFGKEVNPQVISALKYQVSMKVKKEGLDFANFQWKWKN